MNSITNELIELQYTDFLTHMTKVGITSSNTLIGCSPEEIASLERRYDIKLPYSYRRYLEIMGHSSGRLFTHDHAAVTYDYIYSLTNELEKQVSNKTVLPAKSLVIFGRLNEQYLFIVCNNPHDSQVYYTNYNGYPITLEHQSIGEWLSAWCVEAEEAILSGYYSTYAQGTTP